MPKNSRDTSYSSRSDTHEGLSNASVGSASMPLDLVRQSARQRRVLSPGEPVPYHMSSLASRWFETPDSSPQSEPSLSSLQSSIASVDTMVSHEPAIDESPAPSTRPTHAMSPGDTIYDLGQPRSDERKAFLRGPAKYRVDQRARPSEHELSGNEVRNLTAQNITFGTARSWESFSNPLIQTRDDLDQVKAAFRSEAVHKSKATMGAQGRSDAAYKRNQTLGAQGRSDAVYKGNLTRQSDPNWNSPEAQQKRSEAIYKGKATLGYEGRSEAARKSHETKKARQIAFDLDDADSQ